MAISHNTERDMSILKFMRNWTLPISMGTGIASYFILSGAECVRPYHPFILDMVDRIQPILIFSMLFVSFCKIKPSQLAFSRWQGYLLLLQSAVFLLLGGLLAIAPRAEWSILVEAAMLCFICPTATAAIVVAGKLGGNTGTLTTYTILGNLCAAILIPLMIPVIHAQGDTGFTDNILLIINKVFPILAVPFMLAFFLQKMSPRIVGYITYIKDLAFYLWAVALAIAMGITTRSLVHSTYAPGYEVGIAAVSLLACILQFSIGRKVGAKYGEPLSAAQAVGQKNTIFAIWMGSTFLTPVTSLAGGFYSIWHNIYNSYQLYQMRKNV